MAAPTEKDSQEDARRVIMAHNDHGAGPATCADAAAADAAAAYHVDAEVMDEDRLSIYASDDEDFR